jgi:hypothetical protein
LEKKDNISEEYVGIPYGNDTLDKGPRHKRGFAEWCIFNLHGSEF